MVLREGVSSLDAPKVWNFDSLKRSHFVIVSGLQDKYVMYLQYTLGGRGERSQYATYGGLAELAPPSSPTVCKT